jgi:hypothetical protein
MLDMKFLKSRGVSAAAWKGIFTLEAAEMQQKNPRAAKLVERISDRLRQARENNIRDSSVYAAIDCAYRVPFNQTTPTLVQNILSKKLDADGTLEALKKAGLSEKELFLDVPDPRDPLKTVKMLNPPVFFQILIPIVKAYTTIRAAKLFNDRNTSPLLPFAPLKQTQKNRVICEVVTDLVETISTWYGYSEVLKDGIVQALKYGVMLAFTREEWDCETQEFGTGDFDSEGRERGKSQTVKEGLRYIMPHPTRMYYDLQYPLPTINTDTGTEFLGHWQVLRYGDILDNRKYWNRRKIAIGTNWFQQEYAGNFFADVYPCRLSYPPLAPRQDTREDRMAMYSTHNRDHAVFLTNHFEKIVPFDWGLGDYKYPVWVRFIMAGEETVIWAGPCAYTPAWFIGYDYDSQSAQQSSFSLEAIPFQDHLGNLLTQMILTAKQNLANVTYYDTNIVNKDDVTALKNLGERYYRSVNWLPFDSMKAQRAGLKAGDAFQSPTMPYRDIGQLVTIMSNVLNLMERVLQMSSQEVGAAAQHYQSAQEIGVLQSASGNRLAFTGSGVDSGVSGWKRQIYAASQAYADTDFTAEVSADIPELQTILNELGFEAQFPGKQRIQVKGKRTALRIEGFASNAPGSPRQQNQALAQIIYQTIGAVSQNPELFQKVGSDNIIRLLEDAAKLSGSGNDFKLKVRETEDGGVGPDQIKEAMAAMQQQIMQQVGETVAKPAAESAAKQEADIVQLQQTVEQLRGIFELAQKITDKGAIKEQEAIQKMQLDQAAFQAEEARKQQEHQLGMQRQQEQAALDASIASANAQVDLQAKAEKTAIELAAIEKKAEATVAATKAKAKTAKAKAKSE